MTATEVVNSQTKLLTEEQKKQRISELVRLRSAIQKWIETTDNTDKKSALIGVSMYIQGRIKMLSYHT
jgi:CCR4-NOT transcriptional regulation complex NOT5 subunit